MEKFYRFCLESLAWLISRLPIRGQLAIGDFIGWLWFDLFRIRRDIIMTNLEKAFPQSSLAEKIRIGRLSCSNLGRSFVELCRIPSLGKDTTQYKFEFQGLEHYEKAKAEGKGVSLLSLHLGNGDWATAGLSLNQIPLTIISKHFKMKWLNDFWFDTRRSLGTEFIPPRNSSYSILKALKARKTVVFMLDQFMGPPIGVKTQFFGHETGTAMGLAVMSQRSGAPVVPIYTFRNKDGSTAICFEPPIAFTQKASQDETIAYMTQRYTDKMEELVRRHPEQWMWVHRRWKKFVVK